MAGWLDQFDKLALIHRDQQGHPHLENTRPKARPARVEPNNEH
jgi:hypothetical protein